MEKTRETLSVEEIRALFFNADTLREPAYKVFQVNEGGHRVYCRYNDKGELESYPSVTTLLKQVMPMPPQLLEWIVTNGKDGAAEKRDLAAAYGTFMHIQFERLLIDRSYNFDDVPTVLALYLEQENISKSVFSEWATKIRKDVLAFAQFVTDYNVKPLAIEIALVHPGNRYAGCIDLPCEMTDPKSGLTFRAIVDFKSGRKGFYEEHELQLHLYKDMWNFNFPEVAIERVFNFSPKDWRKSPTYNLKDQTNSANVVKLPHYLALAAIENANRDNTFTIIRGLLELGKGNIADNIFNLSLSDIIKARKISEKALLATESDNTPEKAAKRPANKAKGGKTINVSSENKKSLKNEIDEKLPWENESEPAKPAGPAPEQLAKQAQQAEKEYLLNFEMEL